MLPSRSGILAEAINTKILTKNHPDSPIPTLIFRIPIPIPWIPTLIPRGRGGGGSGEGYLLKTF